MSARAAALPEGVVVLERGWLSSNNVVICGRDEAAVVDTGYVTHAEQTLDLVARAIGKRELTAIANTHLHSDHCGGNSALQQRHGAAQTWIPPGLADAVSRWDEVALTYEPTGQSCPRFRYEHTLSPGSKVLLAGMPWQVHAAPGHDPHSVILFHEESHTLISADSLWQNGFGVVFPELEGESAFGEVAATLDVIEQLAPACIIPGHGGIFTDVAESLARARSRLHAYVKDPRRHAAHAAKVLLKFKLLELQQVPVERLAEWAEKTPYFGLVRERYFAGDGSREWLGELVQQLVHAGVARIAGALVVNT